MKIKNLIVWGCLVFLGTLFSGFVSPQTEIITEEKGGESFAEFLSHFEKAELPYRFSIDDFKQYDVYKKGVSKTAFKKSQKKFSKSKMRKGRGNASPISRVKYIPEVMQGRFGRMGPPELQPVARFFPNKKMVAVVYSSKRSFSTGINTSYNLVVYDLTGNVLFPKTTPKDFKYIFNLGYSSLENTVAFEIDKQGRIWKNTYENIWKNDIKKNSYVNNQLLDFKIKDTQVFELNEKGVAVELKEIPTAARASLN